MSHKFYAGGGAFSVWPELSSQISAPVTGLHFRNVLLLQQVSKISSRSQVDISTTFGPFKLKVPIMIAPMDTISCEAMIVKLHELGALGTLPRAHTEDEFTTNLATCKKLSSKKISCVYSVGLSDAVEEATKYVDNGAKVILIDVAQGGMEIIAKQASKIKTKFPKVTLVAGSVANIFPAKMFKDSGVEIVKIGVGNGSACDTRQQAGTGTPQLSAILDASLVDGLTIIADGGIKYPSDAALALAAGASVVMSGSIFAGTTETPGEVIDGMKVYRGQASAEYMKAHKISRDHRSIEGVSMKVPYKGDVEHVINDFSAGLRSAFSYTGAKNLKEFQEKAVFQYIGENTFHLESLPQRN